MMRSSAIKHDFYSIYPTFTWFTNDPTDFCSSYAHIWNKLKFLDGIDLFIFKGIIIKYFILKSAFIMKQMLFQRKLSE